jgi:hypothetical protein
MTSPYPKSMRRKNVNSKRSRIDSSNNLWLLRDLLAKKKLPLKIILRLMK